MAIGNPITLTSNVASKTISVIATAGQTLFTVTGGYRINQLAVFRNGVRLLDSRDYEARNGSTVTLLSAATVGDALEFQVFDDFRVADAIVSAESEQTISGNLTVSGILTATNLSVTDLSLRHLKATGISTVSDNTQATSTTTGAFIVSGGVGIAKSLFVGGDMSVAGTLTYEDVTNTETAGITTTGGLVVTGLGATFGSGVGIADSIYHIGDDNTAIRFPAADTFTVTTAGSERVRVTSAGRVGVNTTNVLSDLQVITAGQGEDGTFRIGGSAASLGLVFDYDQSGATVSKITANPTYTNTSSLLKICVDGDANADQLVLKGDGRVGIGTEEPDRLLVVAGSDPIIRSEDTDAGNTYAEFKQIQGNLFIDSRSNTSDGTITFRGVGGGSATEKLTITSGGNVDINGTPPWTVTGGNYRNLSISGNDASSSGFLWLGNGAAATNADFDLGRVNFVNGANIVAQIKGTTQTSANDDGRISFLTKSTGSSISETLRIDSSGRVLIGGNSSQNQYGSQSHLQVVGTGFDSSTIALRRDQNNANPPGVIFAKSRSGSVGGSTIVQDGDQIGTMIFAAADGSDLTSLAAEIRVKIDGTPGSNDTPGRIEFHTTADAASSPTERLRITSAGRVGIGTDDPQGFLVIQGNSNDSTTPSIRLQDGTDARQASITNSSGDLILFNSGSDNTPHCKITMFDGNILTLATTNTERLRIDSRGSFQFSNGFMNETVNINSTARNGTQDVNLDDGMVHYFTASATGTWKPNFTMSSGNDINSTIATGDTFSVTTIVNKSNTNQFANSAQVDGSDITVEFAGGAPTEGGGNNTFDVYHYTIIKTGDDAFIAFVSITNYE